MSSEGLLAKLQFFSEFCGKLGIRLECTVRTANWTNCQYFLLLLLNILFGNQPVTHLKCHYGHIKFLIFLTIDLWRSCWYCLSSKAIARYLLGPYTEPFLCVGEMMFSLHESGNSPHSKTSLNKQTKYMYFETIFAVHLNILLHIPSTHGALFAFIEEMLNIIFSSVIGVFKQPDSLALTWLSNNEGFWVGGRPARSWVVNKLAKICKTFVPINIIGYNRFVFSVYYS